MHCDLSVVSFKSILWRYLTPLHKKILPSLPQTSHYGQGFRSIRKVSSCVCSCFCYSLFRLSPPVLNRITTFSCVFLPLTVLLSLPWLPESPFSFFPFFHVCSLNFFIGCCLVYLGCTTSFCLSFCPHSQIVLLNYWIKSLDWMLLHCSFISKLCFCFVFFSPLWETCISLLGV